MFCSCSRASRLRWPSAPGLGVDLSCCARAELAQIVPVVFSMRVLGSIRRISNAAARGRLFGCSSSKVVSAPSRRQAASMVMANLPKESKQAMAVTLRPTRRLVLRAPSTPFPYGAKLLAFLGAMLRQGRSLGVSISVPPAPPSLGSSAGRSGCARKLQRSWRRSRRFQKRFGSWRRWRGCAGSWLMPIGPPKPCRGATAKLLLTLCLQGIAPHRSGARW